jgi:hypothetical protein
MTSAWRAQAGTKPDEPSLDDAFDLELEQMALATTEPPLEEPREPGMLRYAKFQLRDFIKHRAAIILPIALVGLYLFHHNFEPALMERAVQRGKVVDGPSASMWFRMIVMGGSMLLGGIGSLVSAAGIVARDREGGYQKFTFAKPVRITRYYLQSFAVNGVGLLATSALVLLLTSLAFLRPVPLLEALLAIGATYTAVGGLVFLISTLVRFDVALGLLGAVLSFALREAAQRGKWWGVAFAWLLPPLDQLRAFFPQGGGPDRPSIVQAVTSLVAYGAAYVAAGVAVLRKRSIMR